MEPMNESIPSTAPSRAAHPALRSVASQTLIVVLEDKDGQQPDSIYKLAPLYLGAKMTLRQTDNPDYLAQAAHSIRELIDALPKRFDVPTFEYQDLRSRSRILVDAWKKVDHSNRASSPKARAKFEKEMARFATELDAVTVTRRAEAGMLISSMDVSGRRMPTVIEDLRVSEWGAYRVFFGGAFHHGGITSDDLEQMLEQFEIFLLDRLRPRAVADQSALKAIVQEGEARA